MTRLPPAFSRFILASGATNLADGIAVVAWAWVATLLTRDPLLVALVPVALRLPWAICAIPAGIITDRADRRRLILAMDLTRGLAFGAAALILWLALPLAADPPARGTSAPLVFVALMGCAALVGLAEVLRDNAAQTILPSIVAKADLEHANGRLWSIELIGNALIGPALGAVLIAISAPLPFALNMLAYLAALTLVARLTGSFRPPQRAQANWRAELHEGYSFLRGSRLLRSLALITGAWNLLFQIKSIALVLHVQENFGLGAAAYGLILSGAAVGGILGSLAAPHIIAALGPMRTAQVMLAATPVAFLGVALAPGPVSLGVVLILFQFSGLVWNTVSVSYRQRTIPDGLLGRVNSLYRLLAWGMMPVGLVASGLIVRAAEPLLPRSEALTTPFYAATLGGLALAWIGWGALRRGFHAAAQDAPQTAPQADRPPPQI